MRSAGFLLRPLSGAAGVELMGVDIPSLLEQGATCELRKLCLEHSILLIRGQSLSLSEQVTFAQAFGTVLGDTSKANFVRSTGEIEFHFDHWRFEGRPEPLAFTNLFAIEVPAKGGATVFASIRKAYQRLPSSLCAVIENLTAKHVYDYSDRSVASAPLRIQVAEQSPEQVTAEYPLLRTHPMTGEPTLYASPRNTDRIVGLDKEESEILLNTLFEIVMVEENLYAHAWLPGDLIIWDNNAVLHSRRPFDARHPRRLRRLCIH